MQVRRMGNLARTTRTGVTGAADSPTPTPLLIPTQVVLSTPLSLAASLLPPLSCRLSPVAASLSPSCRRLSLSPLVSPAASCRLVPPPLPSPSPSP